MEKIPNKKLKSYLIGGVLAAVLVAVLIIFWWELAPRDRSGSAESFVVKSGQATREIAENLYERKLIKSSTCFLVIAKLEGGVIQAGVYNVSPAESTKQIYESLSGETPSEYLVTIPEGWRVTQIDELLAERGVVTAGAFTRIASGDEGYLFPDTYRMLPKSDPQDAREQMLDNFEKKIAGLKVNKQTIILASIVEREAKFDEDRGKIAQVYLNRLAIGMKLDADPTVQYAKGSWNPIRSSDYRDTLSSYNTYLHAGLPPGPICNPGLKSIRAVLNPTANDFLYFFTDSSGHAVFAKTQAEQDQNLKNYQ